MWPDYMMLAHILSALTAQRSVLQAKKMHIAVATAILCQSDQILKILLEGMTKYTRRQYNAASNFWNQLKELQQRIAE